MELLELTEATNEECVERMCRGIRDGELMLFPTDTVYGLGGSAFSRKVLDKLVKLKPERSAKPTAILIDSMIRLSQYSGEVPGPKLVHLCETYWPGPLTVVWHAAPTIPVEFQGANRSLGYRIPNHELIVEAMRRTERALWATSANLPGRPAPKLFSEIDPIIADACDLVIKTKHLLLGRSSTVVDVRGKLPEIVREGAISGDDIQKIWKKG